MNIAFVSGFWLGLSLLLAIGAQNAFVLRQGIRGEYVFVVCLICAVSDAALIALGVAGMGAIVDLYPWLIDWLRYGGAAFLFVYGGRSLYSAFSQSHAIETNGRGAGLPLGQVVATCLLLTWANPHVYLDTLVLLGSIAAQFGPYDVVFAFGAIVASFTFFFALGYGARSLRGTFTSPSAWRALDAFVGAVMWAIAFGLVLNGT